MDEQRPSGLSRSPLSTYGGPSTVSAGMAGSLAQRTGTPSIVSQGMKGAISQRYGGPSTVSAGLKGSIAQRAGSPSLVSQGLSGSLAQRTGAPSIVSQGMRSAITQGQGSTSEVLTGVRAPVGAGLIQQAAARMRGQGAAPQTTEQRMKAAWTENQMPADNPVLGRMSLRDMAAFLRKQQESIDVNREADERSRYALADAAAMQAQDARAQAAAGAQRSNALIRSAVYTPPLDVDAMLSNMNLREAEF